MPGLIAVTGASGFVGRRLCTKLGSLGFTVRGVGRRGGAGPWEQWAECDISHSVSAHVLEGIDTVFHAAGRAHMGTPEESNQHLFFGVNRDGTINLAQAAKAAGVRRFIFISSVKAAGDPGPLCVDETWAAPPDDAYGQSKLEAERALLSVGSAAGMHVCCLRPTLVYGPGVKGNLWRMMRAIDKHRFPPIPEYGNRRSLVHVDDLVTAAILAMEQERANGRTYIVTEPEPYSTRQIYELLALALEGSVPRWSLPDGLLRVGARIGDLCEHWGRSVGFDTRAYARLSSSACYMADRINCELGFAAAHRLEDAACEMVRAFRA